ncbi:helix-turn-helix transcriptional regulator [Candidatus Woesearchaeota archaeon]|nr:helix-turn-helix transcriptional regulator [Candidatus Woesearchaeota archaeon]
MENSVEVKVLEIIRNSKEKIPTQEIAKKLNLERHTTSKYLEILQSKGLIESQIIGRTKLWHPSNSPILSIIRDGNPLREVLNSFDDGITIMKENKEIIWANNKVEQASFCYENYSEEHCKDCPAVKTFKTGKKHRTINTYTRDGKKVSYELITSPIKDNEQKTVAVMEISRKLKR